MSLNERATVDDSAVCLQILWQVTAVIGLCAIVTKGESSYILMRRLGALWQVITFLYNRIKLYTSKDYIQVKVGWKKPFVLTTLSHNANG